MIRFRFAVVAAIVFTAVSQARVTPTGTAFTYQGQLKQSAEPVDDTADFGFPVPAVARRGELSLALGSARE